MPLGPHQPVGKTSWGSGHMWPPIASSWFLACPCLQFPRSSIEKLFKLVETSIPVSELEHVISPFKTIGNW